ncbi:MAG: hypothetical protein M1819_006288 [Sarea resinae]|nr:MAG: hypothetical protein M1819_006288 [Sarea resinae]
MEKMRMKRKSLKELRTPIVLVDLIKAYLGGIHGKAPYFRPLQSHSVLPVPARVRQDDLRRVLWWCAAVAVKGYPPAATSSVARPTGHPQFGDRFGNFQPNTSVTGTPVLATGGQVDISALEVSSIDNDDGVGAGTDSYTFWSGNGSTWPDKSQWVSFDDMFTNNKAVMETSCEQWNETDNSSDEIGAIYDSIQTVATESLVDHRFILAIMMQESGGCVRVPTTNYGVRNPGLMQDHDGNGTCNSDVTGQVQDPCPTGVITEMIREGTEGTDSGDGLAQCINESDANDTSAFYRAARIYNSGSVDSSGDLGKGIATHCYTSDIANRLTGWVQAPSTCTLDD